MEENERGAPQEETRGAKRRQRGERRGARTKEGAGAEDAGICLPQGQLGLDHANLTHTEHAGGYMYTFGNAMLATIPWFKVPSSMVGSDHGVLQLLGL